MQVPPHLQFLVAFIIKAYAFQDPCPPQCLKYPSRHSDSVQALTASGAICVDASEHACGDGHINVQKPSRRNLVIAFEAFLNQSSRAIISSLESGWKLSISRPFEARIVRAWAGTS